MKKISTVPVLLIPDSVGWCLIRTGNPPQRYASLEAAAASLPASVPVHLALPCQDILFERLSLPSTDREELSGMIQLQLEKTLPFPLEEISSGFLIVKEHETESVVVSAVVQLGAIEAQSQSLRAVGRLPEKITPFAMHLAGDSPSDETILLVYPEQGQTVVAIVENRRIVWTQVIPSVEPEELRDALPQLMLSAEMEGVPAEFSAVRWADSAPLFGEILENFFPIPCGSFSVESNLSSPEINLVPPSWESDLARGNRAAQWKSRLIGGAVIYLLIVVLAFVYLGWLKAKAEKIDVRYRAMQPILQQVQARENLWKTLAPAVDPSRYAVELLYQASRNLPTDGIRITEFDLQSTQWRIIGEAPSANLAIDYVSRLKAEKELKTFLIDAKPPQLLPNEHAQFTIYGKL